MPDPNYRRPTYKPLPEWRIKLGSWFAERKLFFGVALYILACVWSCVDDRYAYREDWPPVANHPCYINDDC